MPKISEEIRNAVVDGRWDERAQRAAIYADAAPRLMDACNDVYYAYHRTADPDHAKNLKAAIALCGEVTRAAWRGLGYPDWAREVFPDSIGLPGPAADQARIAAEKALGRLDTAKADDSALYHVRA